MGIVMWKGQPIDSALVGGDPPPEPGTGILIPPEELRNGSEVGGPCVVEGVWVGTSAGAPVWMVSVKERPGYGYNWAMLAPRQVELEATLSLAPPESA